jgi:hypothetical protein
MSGMGNNERMRVDGKATKEGVKIAGSLPAIVPEPKKEVAGGVIDPRLQKWSREVALVCSSGWAVMEEVIRTKGRDVNPGYIETDPFQRFVHSNPFLFQHVGDAFETGLLIYGSRSLIEMADLFQQRLGGKQWDPRVKMWVSVLIGMGIPIVLEVTGSHLGGNIPDPLDALGPVISGILAGGSWELTSFLTDSENWVKAEALGEKYGQKFVETDLFIRSNLDTTVKLIKDKSNRVEDALGMLSLHMDKFDQKLKEWDPNKPFREYLSKTEDWSDRAAEALVRILAERFAKK